MKILRCPPIAVFISNSFNSTTSSHSNKTRLIADIKPYHGHFLYNFWKAYSARFSGYSQTSPKHVSVSYISFQYGWQRRKILRVCVQCFHSQKTFPSQWLKISFFPCFFPIKLPSIKSLNFLPLFATCFYQNSYIELYINKTPGAGVHSACK